MKILKTKHQANDYIQIYIEKEELKDNFTNEKIKSLKSKNNKVAIFVSGKQDYKKILEQIINFEVEKEHDL